MVRTVDWSCICGAEIIDALAEENETRQCSRCDALMHQRWWGTRKRNAQWSDTDAVLVHVDPKTGDVRYPGRHDARLKEGYERQYLRNLQEVNKFEKEHQVANHVMHFDRNGRDLQDWNVGHH